MKIDKPVGMFFIAFFQVFNRAVVFSRLKMTLTIDSEFEFFQYFCWDISIVFVSTHPLLQFRRAPIFSG